jgi:hypothetical protein
MAADLDALQERYDFVLAACRDAQTLASRYAWALREIADMDPSGQRADDLGRAARAARGALLGAAGAKGSSRCPHCDDTGDVHAPTGEWRGYCTCQAGQELRGIDAEHDPTGLPGTSNDQGEKRG